MESFMSDDEDVTSKVRFADALVRCELVKKQVAQTNGERFVCDEIARQIRDLPLWTGGRFKESE
jgi:hypothetical protein